MHVPARAHAIARVSRDSVFEGRNYMHVKSVFQYFYFPDRPIKGGDILDFKKVRNLRKGEVDLKNERYEPPYQL